MKDSPLRVQARVISALMLRDVKTRFGGKAANYLIAILWPLSHIGMLMLIYTAVGRAPPIGDSAALFFATGLLPFMIFQYSSRLMMQAHMMNAPLLNFPIVTFLDLVLARALLELITGFTIILVLALVLYGLDVDIVPRHPAEAAAALLASLFLALGIGILNCVITKFVKLWFFGYILLVIVLYITSGILFMVETLPAQYKDILVWNPGVQIVEWFRSAYYEGYGSTTLDRSYVLTIGLFALAIGLTAERVTRRFDFK